MLEGVLAPGRHRRRDPDPRLHARRQDRHRQQGRQRRLLDNGLLARRSSASRRPRTRRSRRSCWSTTPSTGCVYGTEVAAPAWQKIMDFALPYLKVPPALGRSRESPRLARHRLRRRCCSRELSPGGPPIEVASLAYDSRAVAPGALFFCVPGARSDGHDLAAAGDRARRRRARRRAPARARRARAASSPRCARRWRRSRCASTATRARRCASSASPAPTARRRPPSCSPRCSRPPASRAGCSAPSSR